jgi:hypothetical protein
MTTRRERAERRSANAVTRERRHVAIHVLTVAGLSGSEVAAVLERCGIRPASGRVWSARSIANTAARLRRES